MAVASAGRKADMPIHDKMSSSTCSKARSPLKPIPDSKFSRPGCAPPEAEQRLGLARHACVDSTGEGETFGFHRRDIRRAIGEGLTCRPLPLTAADTLAWFHTLPAERQAKLRAGLTAEREAELLAKLRA